MTNNSTDETKILDSSAVIFKNKFGVYQLRYWLRQENKYYRRSLHTKVKDEAIRRAKDQYFKIQVDIKEGKKQFSISVKEAVQNYLDYQKTRIGDSDFQIVKGRYNAIEVVMGHFLEYVRKDDKISDLDENTIRHYERNGVITNYVQFRKNKNIKDVTIRNEITTFNNFIRYCYEFTKVTHIAKFHWPQMPKKDYNIDGEVIRRQTFTSDEYKKFTDALRSYTANKYTKHLTAQEKFERHLNRAYFLFSANSGLRSSEVRRLQWKNISTYKDKSRRGVEDIFCNVLVDRSTSKVRKTRRVFCRGGVHIERWKKVCAENGRKLTGNVFSLNGKEYGRTNTHRQFRKVMAMTDIEQHRKDCLVPYSLRHYMITERVKAGCSFGQVAIMCGTSIGQIENTYLHLNEEMMKTTAKADYITLEDGTIQVI